MPRPASVAKARATSRRPHRYSFGLPGVTSAATRTTPTTMLPSRQTFPAARSVRPTLSSNASKDPMSFKPQTERRSALLAWDELVANVNGRTVLEQAGVRDPENVCEDFDRRGYDGSGDCPSDGHYLCTMCSKLSPEAPRFVEHGRGGRADRLRLFWRRTR